MPSSVSDQRHFASTESRPDDLLCTWPEERRDRSASAPAASALRDYRQIAPLVVAIAPILKRTCLAVRGSELAWPHRAVYSARQEDLGSLAVHPAACPRSDS